MKKVLVTGGLGYIGSHTVVELQQSGYEAIVIDNLSNSSIAVLDGIEKITGKRPSFFQFDLCDAERLTQFAKEHPDLDTIIHFAAFKAVGESVEKPTLYYKNNLLSLINLLEAFADKAINFVFSSSCTVYGQPDTLPVSEQAPIKKALSPYGNTKQIGEEILFDQSRISPLKVASLRYFNPIGAHASAAIGELPNGTPNNLLPYITQTAIGKRSSLTVFGDDYATPDGSCIRDYIHVVDLAKAHIAACEYLHKLSEKNSFDVFNLGTGKGYSVFEIINTFEKVSGKKLNYSIGKRRSGDTEIVYGDTQLANKLLGWKAALDLESMIQSAWAWEQALAANSK